MQDLGNTFIVDEQPVVTADSVGRAVAAEAPPVLTFPDNPVADPSLGVNTLEVAAAGVIFEPETPARNLYLVQTGQVRLYQVGPDNSGRLVEILGPGDWFGTAALANPGRQGYGTRAVAVTGAVVSEVPAERWLDLLERQPRLAGEWVRKLAGKLEAARADAACLVFNDCNQRLIRALLHLSRTAAAAPHAEGVVLRITHQQLAQAVGAARETISLALTQLRQRNVLRTGRNQLFFNPEVLEKVTNGRRQEVYPNEQVA